MVRVQEVMEALERIAPKRLAEDWDNPGLLVGSPEGEVARVLVALDVSDQVVKTAIREGAGMIVAHHPLIFRAIKKIRTDTPLGARLQMLLSHDIAVAAAHTNLDIAKGGVNDVLAAAVGLQNLKSFVVVEKTDAGEESLGRIGYLTESMPIEAFARQVAAALPIDSMRLVKAGEHPVQKVALCSGSGAEFIERAAFLGADAYLTGDVRYHDAQHAAELGIHVIDAGHFGTEFPVVEVLAKCLKEELAEKQVSILHDSASKDFFTAIA